MGMIILPLLGGLAVILTVVNIAGITAYWKLRQLKATLTVWVALILCMGILVRLGFYLISGLRGDASIGYKGWQIALLGFVLCGLSPLFGTMVAGLFANNRQEPSGTKDSNSTDATY